MKEKIKIENSSSISEIEYSTDDHVLIVLFATGKSYKYFDVPKSVIRELIDSESAGKYFHANIKTKFNYELIK